MELVGTETDGWQRCQSSSRELAEQSRAAEMAKQDSRVLGKAAEQLITSENLSQRKTAESKI